MLKTLNWMPQELNYNLMVNPNRYARVVVGAIRAVEGQMLNRDIYFDLLADRVQKMITDSDEPYQSTWYLHDQMLRESLTDDSLPKPEEVGKRLIKDNPYLQERLHLMLLPGDDLPFMLTENDPEAERLIDETTAEDWIDALTFR